MARLVILVRLALLLGCLVGLLTADERPVRLLFVVIALQFAYGWGQDLFFSRIMSRLDALDRRYDSDAAFIRRHVANDAV